MFQYQNFTPHTFQTVLFTYMYKGGSESYHIVSTILLVFLTQQAIPVKVHFEVCA